MLECNRKNS